MRATNIDLTAGVCCAKSVSAIEIFQITPASLTPRTLTRAVVLDDDATEWHYDDVTAPRIRRRKIHIMYTRNCPPTILIARTVKC